MVYRITLPMAEGILNGLASNDQYWHLSYDCTGRMSIDPKVKLVAALKMACYGVSFTAWKDYAQMGESTAKTSAVPTSPTFKFPMNGKAYVSRVEINCAPCLGFRQVGKCSE